MIVLCLLAATAALAQSSGGRLGEVRATFGGAVFLDESFPAHSVVGGGVRGYVSKRWSLGGEFTYMRHTARDQDYLLTGEAAWDFLSRGRVVPYVVVGAGILWHRDKLIRFTSTEGTIGGGPGVRVYLTERLFVAPEFRIGWEPIFRVTGSIGYTFGK